MTRPTGLFEQPVRTVLGLVVVCAGPLILLAGVSGYVPDDDRTAVVVTGLVRTPLTLVVLVLAIAGTLRDGVRVLVTVPVRPPFTTSHLVAAGEEIVEVGASFPVDVHPTRDLFRLAADAR